MELNVLNGHTLEFRQAGGWTRLDDGRVKGDIRLVCTNACELVVLSFTANFRMTPVAGRGEGRHACVRRFDARFRRRPHLL